jgi:hypothetical protein
VEPSRPPNKPRTTAGIVLRRTGHAGKKPVLVNAPRLAGPALYAAMVLDKMQSTTVRVADSSNGAPPPFAAVFPVSVVFRSVVCPSCTGRRHRQSSGDGRGDSAVNLEHPAAPAAANRDSGRGARWFPSRWYHLAPAGREPG